MTIALVAIVKDEAEYVGRMLASAAPYVIRSYVVDTGSTDDTMRIAEDADAFVFSIPWENFGQARTEALSLARGDADWLLLLDADMTVEIDPDFEPDPAVEAYMVKLELGGMEWRLPLLVRGDLPWRSVGAVHEYLDLPGASYRREATDKVRVAVEDRSSSEKSRWYAQMLEAEFERDPWNPRTVFYLAQTYRDLGDPRAKAMYEMRAHMNGWDQETWYARYRAALLEPWPQRMEALMAAWENRPHRLEPLHDLVAEMNRRSLHYAVYSLTSRIEPAETGDTLFVHSAAWRWGIMFERAIAAWWVGERAEAAMINRHLLELPDLPDNIRAAVERNLSF